MWQKSLSLIVNACWLWLVCRQLVGDNPELDVTLVALSKILSLPKKMYPGTSLVRKGPFPEPPTRVQPLE